MKINLLSVEGTPATEEARHLAEGLGGVCIGQCTGWDERFFAWVKHTFGNDAHITDKAWCITGDPHMNFTVMDAGGCRFHLQSFA